jgi:sulfopyruvate decarboxylase subunit alpha
MVPCKLLADLITLIQKDPDCAHTLVTREEEGIGLLAGAFLAGKRCAIVMQNSGIGNCVNAICSLLNYYKIPIVFIISHRGSDGERIDAQKPMGNVTKTLLETVDVGVYEISTVDELHLLEKSINESFEREKSVAFLFPFRFWLDGS